MDEVLDRQGFDFKSSQTMQGKELHDFLFRLYDYATALPAKYNLAIQIAITNF